MFIRRRNLSAVALLLALQTVAGATVEIVSVSQNAETVGLHDKFELTFTLSRSYENPFDPCVVDITAAFAQPDGNRVTIPAFFYQDYQYVGGRYVNGDNPCWKVRFAPSQTGEYRVSRITVVDVNGVTVIDPQATFTCAESDLKGIIRTDSRDPGYLRYADGRPYLPIGHNVCWLPKGPGDWNDYFTPMSAVGENWTRIWMTHFYEGQILEWSTRKGSYFHGVGRLSLEMGWKLDRIVELAEQKGIAIQLVLQHHGQFSTTTDSNWRDNPYNIANASYDGGFLQHAEDFFTDRGAIRLTKNKFRYIVARWGYSPAILAWELWNEVQYTDGWQKNRPSVVAWHKEMADYLAAIDPFHHLVTTSSDATGFDALWSLDGIDVVQVHHYGAQTAAFIDSMTERLAGCGKPVLLGEFGVGKTLDVDVPEQNFQVLPEPYKSQMLEALDLHNGIWSAFHRKSGAHLWWWDSYIEALDLYDEFVALVSYAQGEDPAAHGLARADLDTAGQPRQVLVSPGLDGFWDVSTQTQFIVQQDGSVPGIGQLSAWLHGSSKSDCRSDPSFTIDLAEGDVLRIHVQEVSAWGTNSLRVLVDSVQVFASSYEDGSTGLLIEVPLPAGRHTVKVQNTGDDWFHIASYEFTNPVRSPLEFIGLSGKDRAYLWVHDVDSGYGRTAHGVFSGVTFLLRGLNDGLYVVEFHETRGPGGILHTDHTYSGEGGLRINVPDFSRDIAVKVRPAPEE